MAIEAKIVATLRQSREGSDWVAYEGLLDHW